MEKNNLNDQKALKVIELANELSNKAGGNIVYISNCPLAKQHLNESIKFLDISDIELVTSKILKTIIEQVTTEVEAVQIILIDNLSNTLNPNEINDFLKDVNEISTKSGVKILFGLDRENETSVDGLDIEKID